MTDSDIFDEFEKLFGNYRDHADRAAELNTPNVEDDEFVKMAIIGFSNYQKIDAWEHEHWKLVGEYLSECERLGDTSKMKKLAALLLGALLGLYSLERIDDVVYRQGYILLPGFVLSKGGQVESM